MQQIDNEQKKIDAKKKLQSFIFDAGLCKDVCIIISLNPIA